MSGARKQPATRRPIRRDLAGRGVGVVFTNNRREIFGSAGVVNLFNNPLQVISAKHGHARKFIAASSQHARITPPPGIIDLSGDFAVVVAFVADSTANARIIHYSDTKNTLNLQLMFLTNRLSLAVGTDSNGYAKAHSVANLDPGVPYVVVAGRSAGSYFMYLDGVLQNDGGTGGIANNIVSSDIQIARRGDATSYFSGQVSLFAHIKGQVDARRLSLNPWQLFEDDDEPILLQSVPAPSSGVVGADAIQVNTGTAGSIGQVQHLGGTLGNQSNLGDAAALVQQQNLVGADGSSDSAGSGGGIGQVQALAGVDGVQGSEGSAGPMTQTQNLAGADSQQGNAGDSAAIEVIPQGDLVGAAGHQVNAGTGGAITQVLQLGVGAGGEQDNSGSIAAIGQAQNLISAPAQQENLGGVGSITVTVPDLIGAPATQANDGGPGAVGQTLQLAGIDAAQANTGSLAQLVRQGFALIYTDPGEQRFHAPAGEQRVWRAAGEQRILTLH